MSTTAVSYPVVAALVKAEDMEGMGANRQWQAVNDTQTRFLQEFFRACRGEVGGIREIESIASWNVEEVNAFLRQRGFTIQLKSFDKNTFGVASVLDLLVEWLVKGEVTSVQGVDHKTYPGVKISKGGVQFYNARGHNSPIALLETKTGDRVYMTMLGSAPNDGFDLIARVEALSRSLSPNREFGGLDFPMVDLDQHVDIGWMLGMKTTGYDGQPAWITQALQQTILKMNEVGARAKSAVAIAVTRGGGMKKPDLIINGPFLVWFERDGLAKPLFVGHITQEDWRNPGDITK